MTTTASPLNTLLTGTTPALVAHTLIRLRGPQAGVINATNARTPQAKVTLTLGGILMTFWSASAAQGVLEGISAVKLALLNLPAAVAGADDPYGQCTVAVDWTSRPSYAAVPQARRIEGGRTTLRYVDVHMGPITWQLLDRVAYHDLTDKLREAHRVAVAVCLDGDRHSADPTRDDYEPQR